MPQLWGSSVSIIYYLITVTVVQLAMGQKYFELSQSSPKFLQAELVCNEDFFLSPFFSLLGPCRKFGSPYLVKPHDGTAHTTLPFHTSVCSCFMCPNNGVVASVGIFNDCVHRCQ